ncbi:purine-cytosine permease FCY21 [Sporormia fimetaria CBS 119925]|uniref:Purine-cytosine permease FCY21 n=1 Tax=Sporormia fimetaria CBS 119925 TaxID=1340428 RepID=A0A6A6V1Q4_9PLEO|nr:purine-cytosine permease FCY21 [Sporormia fimetaria CBS 119925]
MWAKTTRLLARLESKGQVELRGATPVPYEERTVTRYFDIFSLWFCMSCSPLPITFGMVGTKSFGLSLRDASLVILFFTIISTIPVAYMCTWGPKTGMRQLVLARFAFGKYFTSILVLLNLATLTGFCIIVSIIGGMSLSSVTYGTTITPTVGIVIIGFLGLLISFCGFKVLHVYERYMWIPALIAIIITTGCGGKHLFNQVAVPPATVKQVFSFGGLVASFMLPWAALASDFSTYMHPKAPTLRIAAYTYAGLALPTILLMTLGAAIGATTPLMPSWTSGYTTNYASGVLAAMLLPAGGFGQFISVILGFSMLGNLAATMYSITLNFQLLLPVFMRVPRWAYSILITAITIGVGIEAAKKFFINLENFVGVIGYWSAVFIAIVLMEHLVFRGGRYESYTEEGAWMDKSRLPRGYAALVAMLCGFGVVVPCMGQIWWTGPVAERSGDVGFEVGGVVSGVVYVGARWVERRWTGR